MVDSLTDVAATHDPLTIVASKQPPGGGTEGSPPPVVIKGHGHAGVLRSARKLFANIRDVVLDAIEDLEGYDILMTGHSLGGAVGAVLALFMREDGDFTCRARAICLGPPPCLSQNIAEDLNDSVVTIVNGSDIVPRLTVNVLLPYFATARYVSGLNKAKKMLIDLGLHNVAVDWEHLMKTSKEDQISKRSQLDPGRLCVPGIVLQMVHPKAVRRRDALGLNLFSNLEVDMIRVRRTRLARVRKEKDMFINHAPHKYRQSLVAALKSLDGGRLRRTANSGSLLSSLSLLHTSTVAEGDGYLDGSDSDDDSSSGDMRSPPRPVEIDSGDIVFSSLRRQTSMDFEDLMM